MKVLIVSSNARSLINFRGPLLLKIKNLGHEVYTLSPDTELGIKGKLLEMGVYCYEYRLERTGLNIISDIKTLINLIKLINTIRPNLVFSYTIKPVIYGSIAAYYCKVPKIFSMITGLGSTFSNINGFKQWGINFLIVQLYKIACSRNRGVIFQNPDDKFFFIKKNIINDDRAYQVNGTGVDLNFYSFQPPQEFPIRFIFIGRLLVEKGLNEYLNACKIIKEKYPNVICDLLGPIENKKDATNIETINSWVKEGVINYLGDTSDVRPYIKSSSVYVLPSYYGEGIPRTILECLAMGRPIITCDSPGCRETVVNEINGYLVPIKNSIALAHAMERFVLDRNLIAEMGRKSRLLAETKFDIELINNDMINILQLQNSTFEDKNP